VIPAAVFLLWWILTGTHVIPATALSTPRATWDSFTYLLNRQDLAGDVGVSLRRAALGLALGAGVGTALGIIVGLYRLGEELELRDRLLAELGVHREAADSSG